MFDNAKKIKYIDFSNFKSNSLINLYSVFSWCQELLYLNLSSMKTSNVDNMNYLFNRLKKIRVLDISNFSINNQLHLYYTFEFCYNDDLGGTCDGDTIKYIGLKNFNANETVVSLLRTKLNSLNYPLTVCQNKEILTNPNYIYKCCEFDPDKNICINRNYITIKYSKQSSYDKGFTNNYRKGIEYIINGDSVLGENEKLVIQKDGSITVHLFNNISNLNNFFDTEYDSLSANIVSIDLSHLNISLIKDMSSFFKGCSSLKSVNLTNIKKHYH